MQTNSELSDPSNPSNQYTNIPLSSDIESQANLNLNPNPSTRLKPNPIQLNPSPHIELVNSSDKFGCLAGCVGILFALGLIGLGITYVVYVIISLCETSYHEQKDMCGKSNAWLYLLLGLIIGTVSNTSAAKNKARARSDSSESKSGSSPACSTIIQGLVPLCFTIWGCIELFGVGCVGELKSTLLYTMLEVSVIANLVIVGLIVVGSSVLCCACCCSKF